ncbi:palladin [Stigmatopora nigra]
MQDGSWNQPLPAISLLLKGSAGGSAPSEGDAIAANDDENGDFADLTAFLSADEIHRSLDLAREAFEDGDRDGDPAQDDPRPETRAVPPPEKTAPVYKQDKPRLVHEGLALHERASSASEFCSRAATFIEELSSIFKGPPQPERPLEDESSSPDSGYLSPGSRQAAAAAAAAGPLSPPCFVQKLKSQEVAEGSPIRLECRVSGNPPPLVRWFCEGRELHNSPDIHIWRDGQLHTLVIAEAFEDDTGRYTCVASNSLGADNTSAEVYIEGASSSDSDGEGSPSKLRSGTMPLQQKKTTSMSLTIRSASPKAPEAPPRRSTLVQSLSQPPQRMQSPLSSAFVAEVSGPPVFTKVLQDAQASEGQVVVLECRVRGGPPLQVRWYRQGQEILDSPDFRILQKKPRSATESDEICTLVIAEAFPEDGGVFRCTASNPHGSVDSSAQLAVSAGTEDSSSSNGPSGDSLALGERVSFPLPPPPPPPPPPTEISLLEVPPKMAPQEVELWAVPEATEAMEPPPTPTPPPPPPPPPPPRSTQAPTESPPTPGKMSPSPGREAPPLPTKPKPKLLNDDSLAEVSLAVFRQRGRQHAKAGLRSAPPPPSQTASLSPKKKTTQRGPRRRRGSDKGRKIVERWAVLKWTHRASGLAETVCERHWFAGARVTWTEWGKFPNMEERDDGRAEKGRERQRLLCKATARSLYRSLVPDGSQSYTRSCPARTPINAQSNAAQLKQLQEQILLEQQEAAALWDQQKQEVPPPSQEATPSASPSPPPLREATPAASPSASPSPPLPPPPSFQELESSATMQASTFNYARPKQFIAAQGGALGSAPQPSGSGPSSPVSPPSLVKTPFPKGGESPGSPSFPPPPPPFLASAESPSGDFPPPPPPPPPPLPPPNFRPTCASPALSDASSPFSSVPPSPASSFLSSVLPATPTGTPTSPAVNALGLPKGNGTVKAFAKKSPAPRTPRPTSDSDIQGSKDAVIQDLERKLRFKEERLSNGQQKLTYEEKMARRLLGADNAATVLKAQDAQEEPATQEYKVSSFEQRLISEIEYRLERSPVEESDDDVHHNDDDGPAGHGAPPVFHAKLKHYKVFEGMPVTFSCKVDGDPKPKVYWFKDGKQISKRSEHYRIGRAAEGTCTLHTATASLDDDGNYTVMAGNPEGRVSCTGRMMVQAVNQRGRSQRSAAGQARRPRSRSRDSGDENDNIQERHFRPHFLQAPGDLIVQEGRLCRMDCKVSGLPTPDLLWQLNGQTVRPDSAHKMLVRENGVHSLIIEPVGARDAGVYTCIASNRAGQNSFNLELIVAAKELHKAPTFAEKLQNTSVSEGHPVRLECRVSGVPYPQIFWKRENESLTHNTDRISMHQDNCGYLCMIIQPARKDDAGWYTVSAKNDAGIVSSTARLDVHAAWQQPSAWKPKTLRPSSSRYAALTERGLDVKAAFFPDCGPLAPGSLVESDDL